MLTESLSLDFNQKTSQTVRFPTLYHLSPDTLLSWLEARKLSLTLGSKFQARIELFITYCLIVTSFCLILWFAVLSNFFSLHLTTPQWISFFIKTVVLVYFSIGVLLPTSVINKQTLLQIRKLLILRENYYRLANDKTIMEQDQASIISTVQRYAVVQLNYIYRDLQGK